MLARVDDYTNYRVLGQSLDDASGEAFDKGARLLGIGYPGGAELSRLAQSGDPEAFDFPTAERVSGLNFSFAGVKTALLYKTKELGENETQRRAADLAAAYEDAIVEALIVRSERALVTEGLDRFAIAGGVAANRLLRSRVKDLGAAVNILPSELCTDNAAMIAAAGLYSKEMEFPEYLDLDVYARSPNR